ncbi:MAG TPA: hypothetical protein VF491_06850, partial [Vicinamibacterales bacterium]
MPTYISVAFLVILACADGAIAQETRAEANRQAREEKQQALTPYEPNMLERILKGVERGGVPLITRDGVYLKLGSLTTGSGFAYGAGYRSRRLFDGAATIDAWGGASATGYWAGEGRLRFPDIANGFVDAQAYARRHDYPREDYFGLGPTSLRRNHTNYGILATTIGARAAVRPVPILSVGGGVEHIDAGLSAGADPALPSIGEVFDEQSAPGVTQQPDYLRTMGFVEVDYRRPLNA